MLEWDCLMLEWDWDRLKLELRLFEIEIVIEFMIRKPIWASLQTSLWYWIFQMYPSRVPRKISFVFKS